METIRLLIIVTILFCISNVLRRQSSFVSFGGTSSGTGGTISYTGGQIVFSSVNDEGGSISEGVQQAYEIFIFTGINNSEMILPEYSVYPNPASEYIIIKTNDEECSDTRYQLSDLAGRICESNEIKSNETKIYLGNLKQSLYVLTIIKSNFVTISSIIIKIE